MKWLVLAFAILPSLLSSAGSYEWKYAGVINGSAYGLELAFYELYGSVRDQGFICAGEIRGEMKVYAEDGGIRMQQMDYTTTGGMMEQKNDVLVYAHKGDVLTAETILAATTFELCDWYDYSETGGMLIDTPEDFYLAFLIEGVEDYKGMSWVGWFHLSVDESLEATLVDSGINLDGGPIIVGGIGPIPEPTSAMLVLFGLAVLALRRRT